MEHKSNDCVGLRQELRDGLAADAFVETNELIAAIDEGIRSARSGSNLSIAGAKELIRKCAFTVGISAQARRDLENIVFFITAREAGQSSRCRLIRGA